MFCARRRRDAALVEHIRQVHADNYGVYGVRKMWHELRRDGIAIGREQTARLMRLAGLSGNGQGRVPVTTRTPKSPDLRSDLVNREFHAPWPNTLWMADITYVFSHRIVGWALSDSMRTESLPLQVLNQAIASTNETAGLVHHSDHGSQYVSISYNERLTEYGISASTGTVGDSYDNALAENVNGSYKNELANTRSFNDATDLEITTLEWVNWCNDSRLHQSLGYRTPAEVEAEYWSHSPAHEIMEIKAHA